MCRISSVYVYHIDDYAMAFVPIVGGNTVFFVVVVRRLVHCLQLHQHEPINKYVVRMNKYTNMEKKKRFYLSNIESQKRTSHSSDIHV